MRQDESLQKNIFALLIYTALYLKQVTDDITSNRTAFATDVLIRTLMFINAWLCDSNTTASNPPLDIGMNADEIPGGQNPEDTQSQDLASQP